MALTQEEKDKFKADIEAQVKAFTDRQDADAAKEKAYYEDLLRALQNDDATAILMRGHLFLENELTNLLRNAVARKEHIGDKGWRPSFENKVYALYAMGLLSNEDRRILGKINAVRNGMVHINAEDQIPHVTQNHVHEIMSAIGKKMRADWDINYSRKNDFKETLRELIAVMVVHFRILVDVSQNADFGLRDMIRYNLSGETVTDRLKKQAELDQYDPPELRAAKDALRKMPWYYFRDFRLWMIEAYHHD